MTFVKVGVCVAVLVPSLAVAASVELMAFADKPVCEKVMQLFGERFAPDLELSKTVEWIPIELQGQGPKIRRCSSLDRTVMDLNNDGRVDLVVRSTFCMKGAPSDSLYVFPADSQVLNEVSWQDMSLLVSTQDKFERTGGTYPLTSLTMEQSTAPPALAGVFSIQLFRLEGVSYIGLTDARREWMAITKYRGREQFEDQCYLRSRTP